LVGRLSNGTLFPSNSNYFLHNRSLSFLLPFVAASPSPLQEPLIG
jgi:hypothetical protein